MSKIFAAAIAMALMTSAAVASDDSVPWGNGEVAGWNIAVDTSLGGGCFIYAVFDGNTLVRIGFDPSSSDYYLILGDDEWKSIESGKEYDLTLRLGSRAPWDAEANGVPLGDGTALMVTSTDTDFLQDFSSQQSIRVEYNGDQIANLDLSGSAAAIQEMINCQETVNAAASSGGDDPFKKTGDGDPFKAD
jgi:hypothetical protein